MAPSSTASVRSAPSSTHSSRSAPCGAAGAAGSGGRGLGGRAPAAAQPTNAAIQQVALPAAASVRQRQAGRTQSSARLAVAPTHPQVGTREVGTRGQRAKQRHTLQVGAAAAPGRARRGGLSPRCPAAAAIWHQLPQPPASMAPAAPAHTPADQSQDHGANAPHTPLVFGFRPASCALPAAPHRRMVPRMSALVYRFLRRSCPLRSSKA